MSILGFRSSNVVHADSPSAMYGNLTAFFSAMGASAPPNSSLFPGLVAASSLLNSASDIEEFAINVVSTSSIHRLHL